LLDAEKKRLQHAEELIQMVAETYHRLYERDNSLVSEISQCLKKVEKGAEVDSRVHSVRECLGAAKVELEEAAFALRDLKKDLFMDPGRLEEVEERVHLLKRLKKKYGLTLEKVMEFREGLSEAMGSLDQKRGRLNEISQAMGELERDMAAKAASLSKKRKVVAKGLEASVRRELGLLGMAGTSFEVRFHEEEAEQGMRGMKPDGYDRMEFLISPNVGEDLKPLSRIASGGELSRIMLALKTILARTGAVETIIFDEVDSGIGGATAEIVGEKLEALAGYHQILCITHLPQIACKGSTHFLVSKDVADSRTKTTIVELGSEKRVKEIARLLAGKRISPQAVAHAREMLR
jgi:DNA repair protein RecN (Recombination protein N)